MPSVRYQVSELPQTGWANAWLPMPSLTPGAQFSLRDRISGHPGTVQVHSPRPAGAYAASTSPEWQGPSAVAPNWFAPQLWVDRIDGLPVAPTNAGSGVKYLPLEEAMPAVPAAPIDGTPPVAMRGRKIGGRRSMHWPRNIIRWPNLNGQYT
ncbi:MAG TPA: hypothetical protein VKU91_01405 [Acidimicrobiales bacterium]|nr:hypothetical protein [Acidimicrobiales bacterium]